jgi:hypothetical protein
MRNVLKNLLFFLPLTLLFGCNKELNVNADWKDVTVVYGLLNQNDSVHYLRITKAFLGPGNALDFARIPDSSYYHDSLEVRMEEWKGSTLQRTFLFHDTLLTDKEAGDSVFYFPDQEVFKTEGKLNVDYTYKMFIVNKKTGKEVTAQTDLIHPFSIDRPLPPPAKASFLPGKFTDVIWYTAKNGRRYQLVIRFHYLEYRVSDTVPVDKYVDWLVFGNEKSLDLNGGQKMDYSISGDAFFIILGGKIPVDPDVSSRAARDVEYIFSVASDDLNTYMEVTEPSSSVVQERPPYTNITNGIGLFASRYDNRVDNARVLQLSDQTIAELKTNPNTADLGF